MRQLLLGFVAIAFLAAGAVAAQQAGFVRIPLQTQDLSTPGKVAVQVRGEFDPGFGLGCHPHLGEELTYILEGEIEVRVDGEPPRVIKVGETFFLPAGVVHEGVNTSSAKVKVLATYIVEKGQPLALPSK